MKDPRTLAAVRSVVLPSFVPNSATTLFVNTAHTGSTSVNFNII